VQALSALPQLRNQFLVYLYDNSPEPAPISDELFPCPYVAVHPKRNSGLPKAYNMALELALSREIPWLVLLDSDTEVTASFLSAVDAVSRDVQDNPSIAALVPHLVENGVVHSPRFSGPFIRPAVGLNTSGVMTREIVAMNSGTTFRAASMQALGGFNSEFWLDYLDYWIFRTLKNKNLSVYVLAEKLQHSLSFADVTERMSIERYRNMLEAERFFVARYGSPWEQIRLKLVLIKRAIGLALHSSNRQFFWLTLALALPATAPIQPPRIEEESAPGETSKS
jgi:glycosyltransferase involved in cell wall biosynthesis